VSPRWRRFRGGPDDTLVVYASDNGYFLGEHNSGDKRALYDESLRIPFLVRYPRLFGKGKTVDEMVLNIDLAPTILDLAGVPVPDDPELVECSRRRRCSRRSSAAAAAGSATS
jgi:arylsulfatase A-like enzyme